MYFFIFTILADSKQYIYIYIYLNIPETTAHNMKINSLGWQNTAGFHIYEHLYVAEQ